MVLRNVAFSVVTEPLVLESSCIEHLLSAHIVPVDVSAEQTRQGALAHDESKQGGETCGDSQGGPGRARCRWSRSQ